MSYDDLTCNPVVKPVARRSTKTRALLRPLDAPRRLTAELVARLTADITSGKLPPGSKLPTEQEMIAATGVSRSVIRRPFRVDFDENSPLRDVLNVMELRTGVEIEAAGLAAQRASATQIRRIANRYDAIQAAIERGELAVDEDFAFHCEIADATGNPQFRRFLEYLGRFIIPRRTVWGSSAPASNRPHLELFQREHREILRAIEKHAVESARGAMQRHLLNSRARYEKIAVERGIK